jgi:hypothetical protein
MPSRCRRLCARMSIGQCSDTQAASACNDSIMRDTCHNTCYVIESLQAAAACVSLHWPIDMRAQKTHTNRDNQPSYFTHTNTNSNSITIYTAQLYTLSRSTIVIKHNMKKTNKNSVIKEIIDWKIKWSRLIGKNNEFSAVTKFNRRPKLYSTDKF